MKNTLAFLRLRKKSYTFKPFVYIDDEGKLLKGEIGTKIRVLSIMHIDAYSYKKAFKMALEKVKIKYAPYKESIFII